MNEVDRVKELVRIMRDPDTDEQTKLDCADEILDMCDPEYIADLARNALFDALEGLKEDAANATDPEAKHRIEQQIEHIELARLTYIQRVTDDDSGDQDD